MVVAENRRHHPQKDARDEEPWESSFLFAAGEPLFPLLLPLLLLFLLLLGSDVNGTVQSGPAVASVVFAAIVAVGSILPNVIDKIVSQTAAHNI